MIAVITSNTIVIGLNEYIALLIYYNILDKINLIYELKK